MATHWRVTEDTVEKAIQQETDLLTKALNAPEDSEESKALANRAERCHPEGKLHEHSWWNANDPTHQKKGIYKASGDAAGQDLAHANTWTEELRAGTLTRLFLRTDALEVGPGVELPDGRRVKLDKAKKE